MCRGITSRIVVNRAHVLLSLWFVETAALSLWLSRKAWRQKFGDGRFFRGFALPNLGLSPSNFADAIGLVRRGVRGSAKSLGDRRFLNGCRSEVGPSPREIAALERWLSEWIRRQKKFARVGTRTWET